VVDRVRQWLVDSRPVPPDPFAVLHVQMRLSELSRQIRVLEDDPYIFAKAHRLRATRAAYDDLLVEACRMAGVSVVDAPRSTEERWREELELSSRGWSW
jgi:hypothetical protein